MSSGTRRPLDMATIPFLFMTAGGLGMLRPASGTWGSLPPAVLVGGLLLAGATPWGCAGALLAMAIVATWACVRWGVDAERGFAGKDPSSVVIDEVAGGAIAALPLAWVSGARPVEVFVLVSANFVLFRLFDVWKPGPIRLMQRWKGGLGIVADDLAAGSLAGVVTMLFTPQLVALASRLQA